MPPLRLRWRVIAQQGNQRAAVNEDRLGCAPQLCPGRRQVNITNQVLERLAGRHAGTTHHQDQIQLFFVRRHFSHHHAVDVGDKVKVAVVAAPGAAAAGTVPVTFGPGGVAARKGMEQVASKLKMITDRVIRNSILT